MAQSRIQLGPCCTVPPGVEHTMDRWDIWRSPGRPSLSIRLAAVAELRKAERKRLHLRALPASFLQSEARA